MKRIGLIIFFGAMAALMAGCGPSGAELASEQQLQQAKLELARRDALEELKRAKAHAVQAGAKFASDGALTRRTQCASRLATDRMKQDVILRQFPEETREPFVNGCVKEANAIVQNQRLAAQEARRVAKAQQMRLAAAKKSSAQKR